MALSDFPGKVFVPRKNLIFYPSPNVAPTPTDQSCSNSISPTRPFHFGPTLNIKGTLMLRVVHMRNKKWSKKHGILQICPIVSVAMLLKQQERPPRKYLLSFISNLLLIEIHLSQIRISDSKREKVCAVCPCLFF